VRTWVLLRGLAREARHWGDFPQVLDARLPVGDRVVALDLPGNGSRCRERSPWSVEAMVAAVRSELQARGLPPPYVLVALSLGGMVALQWAATKPLELLGCILLNTSAAHLSPFWQRLQPRSYPLLVRALLGPVSLRERAIYAMTSAQDPDPEVLARWASYARTHPVASTNALRQLVAAARFRAPAQVQVPILVLTSRGDRLVSPDCSRALAHAWRLPLGEHPVAGHDLPLDDPAWVADQIARWSPEHFAPA
jgi:pimeloyl-ACP methyl ester carboxylesterase